MVVDYFALLHRYNSYAAFHTSIIITFWVTYSILLCFWTFKPDHISSQFEWNFMQVVQIVQVISTITIFTIVGMYSLVEVHSLKLYAEIATSMALDQNRSTKLRWLAILEYYFPIPSYCFMLLKSFKISWLFNFQASLV